MGEENDQQKTLANNGQLHIGLEWGLLEKGWMGVKWLLQETLELCETPTY